MQHVLGSRQAYVVKGRTKVTESMLFKLVDTGQLQSTCNGVMKSLLEHGRAGEEADAAKEGAACAEVAREVEEDVNAEDDEAVEETALAATPIAPRRRAGRKAPKAPKATWVGAPLAEAAGVQTYRCARHSRLAYAPGYEKCCHAA